MKRFQLLVDLFAVMIAIILVVSGVPAYADPIILKVSTWSAAPPNPFTLAGIWILQEVEKRSEGRLKFEYYYASSLIPPKETLAGLKSGIADIAFVSPAYHPGKLPLCGVSRLPATSSGDYYATSMAFGDLIRMPEVKAELDENNIMYLAPLATTSYAVWSRKPIRSVANLKGMKIMAVGEHMLLLKGLGAVPISMVAPETYSALEKGILDGALGNPTYGLWYKWEDVCHYYYDLRFGNSVMFVGINKNSWNKIPGDLQKLFIDLREKACKAGDEIYNAYERKGFRKAAEEKGLKMTKPTSEEVALLRQIAKESVWKDWLEKRSGKGFPAQNLLERWLQLLEKYHAQDPKNG